MFTAALCVIVANLTVALPTPCLIHYRLNGRINMPGAWLASSNLIWKAAPMITSLTSSRLYLSVDRNWIFPLATLVLPRCPKTYSSYISQWRGCSLYRCWCVAQDADEPQREIGAERNSGKTLGIGTVAWPPAQEVVSGAFVTNLFASFLLGGRRLFGACVEALTQCLPRGGNKKNGGLACKSRSRTSEMCLHLLHVCRKPTQILINEFILLGWPRIFHINNVVT